MPPLATLKIWLMEAYQAKHRLMMGETEVELGHSLAGQNTVKFYVADPEKVDAHILWIGGLIAQSQGRGRRAFYIT